MLGIRRVFAVFAVASAAVWLGSSPALAAKPDPVPPPPDVTVDCGPGVGPALLHIAIEKQHVKTTVLSDGTVVQNFEGRAVATVTGNGKTLTVNSSGPATIYFRLDGTVTIVGRGLTFYIPPTLDGAFLYSGHIVIDGNTGLIVSHSGTVRDLCAALK